MPWPDDVLGHLYARGAGSGCRLLGLEGTLEFEDIYQVSGVRKKGE